MVIFKQQVRKKKKEKEWDLWVSNLEDRSGGYKDKIGLQPYEYQSLQSHTLKEHLVRVLLDYWGKLDHMKNFYFLWKVCWNLK